MTKNEIKMVYSHIMADVENGKTVRIIGDMSSSRKNELKYFRFRNMVSKDFGANVCYAGFSKKDFKKLCKMLDKFGNEEPYSFIFMIDGVAVVFPMNKFIEIISEADRIAYDKSVN